MTTAKSAPITPLYVVYDVADLKAAFEQSANAHHDAANAIHEAITPMTWAVHSALWRQDQEALQVLNDYLPHNATQICTANPLSDFETPARFKAEDTFLSQLKTGRVFRL